jgi:menaquinone-dependent protoporphyrinogen oxidase
VKELGAQDHQVLVGKLDKDNLGIGERDITRMVKAPEGDFRDLDAIRAWAQAIATAL